MYSLGFFPAEKISQTVERVSSVACVASVSAGKAEERDCWYFACSDNGARAKKRCPVILCSRTAQKRLLHRLFHRLSKQLEFRPKKTTLRVVFSTLFSVFGYRNEKLSLVFDMSLKILKLSRFGLSSPYKAEFGHFTLLFCRERNEMYQELHCAQPVLCS